MNSFDQVRSLADQLTEAVSEVIFGKGQEIRLILTALFCGGHILLDDYPGTGKTTLAKTLATALGGKVSRIQFTPDLLPSDITGVRYYRSEDGEFIFRPGPVFANIVLADEINRASPRTQSALLECMGEEQVTVDGETHRLPPPFLVLATQNPIDQQGTFPLPEAQRDRFLIKIPLGYPDRTSAARMLEIHAGHPVQKISPVCGTEDILHAASVCGSVAFSEKIRDYVLDITEATRNDSRLVLGVSPRGCLALLKASQAYAAINGRGYVLPDDVKTMAVPVLAHRVIVRNRERFHIFGYADEIITEIVKQIPSPVD